MMELQLMPILFPYTTLFRSLSRRRARAFSRAGGRRYSTRAGGGRGGDRKSTRLNSSHSQISYAVFCLKKKNLDTRNDCGVVLFGNRSDALRKHAAIPELDKH